MVLGGTYGSNMKTLKLLLILTPMFLTACTADVFSVPGDDAGTPETDAATVDATPTPDAAPDAVTAADAQTDAAAQDSAVDASSLDAAKDSGNEPMCAPLGYKACPVQFSKCKVTANDGTATCVVPGVTAHQSACGKDDDCGKDEICDVSLCRSLCQKTYQTPWGVNANTWSYNSCAACPVNTSSNYQLSRLPSWLGVCIY